MFHQNRNNMDTFWIFRCAGFIMIGLAFNSCRKDFAVPDPNAQNPTNQNTTSSIRFGQHIYPILVSSCGGCHNGWNAPDLSSETIAYSELLTKSSMATPVIGPYVDVSNPTNSILYLKISGSSNAMQMPPGGNFLSQNEITLVLNWIKQEAKP